MRFLQRGPEPISLIATRAVELLRLRRLGRDPISKEITGYQCVSAELWRGQNYKCCYCEYKIPEKYNDVEHYRPKAAADRKPGCITTHGYWWLAFTWENLLFACPACNRSSKNSGFPLEVGSIAVTAENLDLRSENPLLVDPYSINPVEHIEFVQTSFPYSSKRWIAVPRSRSQIGNFTIDLCDLNRDELVELRLDHFENNLLPAIDDFYEALRTGVSTVIDLELKKLRRLIANKNVFSAFNYDVLRALIPFDTFSRFGLQDWPMPLQM